MAPRFSGEAAIARARARLGENRYSVLANNCEHFAQWCISGTSRSEQVDSLTARLRGALDGLGSLLAARGSRNRAQSGREFEISATCPQ